MHISLPDYFLDVDSRFGSYRKAKMADNQTRSYSWFIATIYIFNSCAHLSIVALPKAFAEVGIIFGLGLLLLHGVLSYLTCVFVMEALAIQELFMETEDKADRLKNYYCHRSKQTSSVSPISDGTNVQKINPSIDESCFSQNNPSFTIKDENRTIINGTKKDNKELKCDVELNANATCTNSNDSLLKVDCYFLVKSVFPKYGTVLLYICVFFTSFGVIAYSLAAMSKSVTTTLCSDDYAFHGNETTECKSFGMTIFNTNRIVNVCLSLFFLPFAFLHVTKSKIIQILTNACKWLAWISMLTLSIRRMVNKGVKSSKLFGFKKLPDFLGISMFIYLIHVTMITVTIPINNKGKRNLSIKVAFLLAFTLASVISMTTIHAFSPDEIQEMVILNFHSPTFFKYFLLLYPVYSCAGVIPVFISDLREKLLPFFVFKWDPRRILQKVLVPFLAIVPSTMFSIFVSDVRKIMTYTGVFFGGTLQFIIPSILIYCARKKAYQILRSNDDIKKYFFFQHKIWLALPVLWFIICFTVKVYFLATV